MTLTTSVGPNEEEDVSALTLEVPLSFLLPGHVVRLVVTAPCFEYGFPGGDALLDGSSPYHTISQLGLTIGGNTFF